MPRVLRSRARVNYKEPPLRTPGAEGTPSMMMLTQLRGSKRGVGTLKRVGGNLSPVTASPASDDASAVISPALRRRGKAGGNAKGKSKKGRGRAKQAQATPESVLSGGYEEEKGTDGVAMVLDMDSDDDDFAPVASNKRATKGKHKKKAATKRKSRSSAGTSKSGTTKRRRTRKQSTDTADENQHDGGSAGKGSDVKTPGLVRAARATLQPEQPADVDCDDAAASTPQAEPSPSPKATKATRRRASKSGVPPTPKFSKSAVLKDLKNILATTAAQSRHGSCAGTPGKANNAELEALQARFNELKAIRCTEPEKALQAATDAWAKKEAAQQRLIEQLQAQLRGDAPSQQASGCDAETAAKMKAAAEVQAKEVAQLKQQVAKLTQQNKDLSVELAATKSAAATAGVERDACLASLAKAEEETALVHSVYQKLTAITVNIDSSGAGKPCKLSCIAVNKTERKGVAFTLSAANLDDESAPVEYNPTKNSTILPDFLQEPLSFEMEQLPRFTVNLVEGLFDEGDDSDDGGDDDNNGDGVAPEAVAP